MLVQLTWHFCTAVSDTQLGECRLATSCCSAVAQLWEKWDGNFNCCSGISKVNNHATSKNGAPRSRFMPWPMGLFGCVDSESGLDSDSKSKSKTANRVIGRANERYSLPTRRKRHGLKVKVK